MWNRKSVKAPPVCELKTALTDSDIDKLLKAFKMLKDDTSQLLVDHIEVLTNEHYVLSRFIYRIKNQFRREKSLAGFQQINTCLKRLYETDIKTMIKTLKNCMEIQSLLDNSNGQVYVMSRQSIEYHLVRLMGTAALLGRTGNYSQSTFIHVLKHLNVGHLISQNVILCAATARIWYITKSLCIKMCGWYQAVFDCLPFLPPTKVPWMAEDMVLPSNLMEWLTSSGYFEANQSVDEEMADHVNSPCDPEISLFGDYVATTAEDIGEVITRTPVSAEITKGTEVKFMERSKHTSKGDVKHMDIQTKSDQTEQHERKTDIVNRKKKAKQDKTLCIYNELKSFLENRLKKFKDIIAFQDEVKSKELDINGVTLKLNKVKKKKMLSIIQVTLDSIPEDLKISKQRKLFADNAIPELCSLLGRFMSKSEEV